MEAVVVDVIEEPVPGVTVVTEFEATEARQVSGALGKAGFRKSRKFGDIEDFVAEGAHELFGIDRSHAAYQSKTQD